MSKHIKEQIRNIKTEVSDRSIIPPRYQHLAAVAVIYISLLIFFHSMIFDGKKYQSADSLPVWSTFMADAQKDGYATLWNPYIFCGYPGYAGLTYPVPESFDLTTRIWENVVRNYSSYIFFRERANGPFLLFYLVYGIGMYFLAFRFLKNKPASLIVALIAMYSTYVALLIMMGHITKLAVLSWFPFVFLIIDKLREKFNLLLAFLLPICIRLMLEADHVQFLFYIFLALGIYILFFLIRALVKKENLKNILVCGSTLLIAAGIAFLMGAAQHFSTLEYNPYSIRGANPIQTNISDSKNKTVSGGLDYEYATSYSFSPGEIMTFFVPSWYGFGPLPYQGPLTQNHTTRLYLYFGDQPIVDGPQYMGIIAIILAIIGFYKYRKNPLVQCLGIITGFALLVSFGKEFPPVYDLMYRYFPMFNKFRAPVLILMLVQFCVPLLAGHGILSFVSERKTTLSPSQIKQWKYIFIGLAIALFGVLIGKDFVKDIYSSFFPLQDVGKALSREYGSLNPEVVKMLFDFVFSSVITDILVGLVLLILTFGAFYYYQKNKIHSPVLYSLLIAVVLFDLWRVASKPHDPITHQEASSTMAKPDYVNLLEQDTTLYRVLKLMNHQPVYDNTTAYWRLYNAYGYHGAKMRIYQDMLDVAGIGNPVVWQLMNVKYIITNTEESNAALAEIYKNGETRVYAFRYWLPHVFFVNKIDTSDGLAILNKISSTSFNPKDVAYIQENPKPTIDPPAENARVNSVKYGTQNLEVNVTASGNNLLFLSDAYYPKGWYAYIDEKPVEILRLDYLFRGLIIPQGTHTVTMKFEPASFTLGKNISLTLSIITWGGFLLIGSFGIRKPLKEAMLKYRKNKKPDNSLNSI